MSSSFHLWIGNTEQWDSEEQLMDQIRDVTGITVKNCWFPKDRQTGNKLNYGFLEFANLDDAGEALRKLKGSQIPHSNGKRFSVNWGTYKQNSTDQETLKRAEGFSCYVGNLPNYVDDAKLLDLFKQYFPNVINAHIVYSNGVSKGYGFVKFNTHEEVITAIKTLNNSNVFGRSLRVNEGTQNRVTASKDSIDTNKTLFITDLDPTVVNADVLQSQFSLYGKVLQVKIDDNQPSWATIVMEDHAQAESAKNALQNSRFGGLTKCVINWGRLIQETPHYPQRSNSFSVPTFKNPKNTNQEISDFCTNENIHHIIDAIQYNGIKERVQPLRNLNHLYSNRIFSQQQIASRKKLDQYSDQIPHPTKFWYY